MSDIPPPSPPPLPSSADAPRPQQNFLARVFDLEFREFVTPSIIKILFILGIVMSGIFALTIFVGFANMGGGGVLLGLVIAPVVFIMYVLLARVVSELYLLLFKIEANTRTQR